ncbi:MAG TPA: GWxTD domain-containing protein [Thermoanaerobaculia bacterium]|nr:GWxTD domain-containing protein [Thermoanaerobaculia bacterium]
MPRSRRARLAQSLLLPAALALALVAGAGCGSSGATAPARSADLVNFRLGPQYSNWLLGPIARLATPEEIRAYLALDGDFAALDFIEAFWARRDPDPAARGNPVREAFELRAPEADRRYSEAGILGRRTPRGTILVLYGAPEKIEYQSAPEGGEPVEIWRYAPDAPVGLDGRPPERLYWFRKQGELTRFYQPRARPVRTVGR